MARGEASAALRVRDFRIWWIGSLLSNSGTMVQMVTVPYVLYQVTNRASWVGLAQVAQVLPMVLLGPIAGSLADRYPRRRVLLGTQTSATIVSGLLALAWAAGIREPLAYVMLVMVSGCVTGINLPSWQSFVSDLVPHELMLNAITLNSAQFNAARALGPAVGGVILAFLGPGWCFFFNTISYLAVLQALMRLKPKQAPIRDARRDEARVLANFAKTRRYVARTPVLRASVGMIALTSFTGYALPSFLVVFQRDVYQSPKWVLGLLNAAIGVGAVLAAPLVAGRGTRTLPSRRIAASTIVYGAAMSLFGAVGVPVVGVAALCAVGAAHLTVTSTLNTAVQLGVHGELRGKVMALYFMTLNLSVLVGSLVLGFLVDAVGGPWAVVGAGSLLAVPAAWLAATGRLAALDGELAHVSVIGGGENRGDGSNVAAIRRGRPHARA